MSAPLLQRRGGNVDYHSVWKLAKELANMANVGLPIAALRGLRGDRQMLVTLRVAVLPGVVFTSSVSGGLRTTVVRADFEASHAGPECIRQTLLMQDYVGMPDAPLDLSIAVDAVVALIGSMPTNDGLAWIWLPTSSFGIDLGRCVSATTTTDDSPTTGLPVVSAVITFEGLTG